MSHAVRDFSVYPVWIQQLDRHEYAKVRVLGTLAKGQRVEVQRPQSSRWLAGVVVPAPASGEGFASVVCIALIPDVPQR